jgi:hypothetical protein
MLESLSLFRGSEPTEDEKEKIFLSRLGVLNLYVDYLGGTLSKNKFLCLARDYPIYILKGVLGGSYLRFYFLFTF